MKPIEKTLPPVYANVGIEAEYRRRILALVDAMHASVEYWLRAKYKANEPEIAQDASPAVALRAAVRALTRRWQTRFDDASGDLAKYFAKAVADRSDSVLQRILKRSGFSVRWHMTRAMNDVLQATIGEQVGLIKSIPQQYLGQVEGLVMRSVQTGRDLEQLSKALQDQLGVTKRRAALISRDQNNKATANLTRVRQLEVGITEAIWVHSGGGHEPRPSHLKAGKEQVRYDVSKGWLDPDEDRYIFPGELINCRCISRPVIKGFT